jgi:oxidoreductase family, C-terminal alpha/beta domain
MKVAIIGTGVGIRTHLAGLSLLPTVEVVGVVGSTKERTARYLQASGHDQGLAASLDEIMAKSPDIVCLTTPVCNRDEYWKRLAHEQCFILAEKPVCGDDLSIPYFAAVKDRCVVDFQLRGLEQFQIVAEMIKTGTLGDICSIDLFERTAALRANSLPTWMTTPDLGGGQRMAMGSHLLDLAVFLLGGDYLRVQDFQHRAETRRGSWCEKTPKGRRPSDECFDCSFVMNQARVAIRTTSISTATRSLELRVEGTEGAAEFCYRNGSGTLQLFQEKGSDRLYTDKDASAIHQQASYPLDSSVFRVAYNRYFASVCELVKGNKSDIPASLSDGLENARLLR